ncbi:MAG: cytochrome P450 [Actinocatenispora sp.]
MTTAALPSPARSALLGHLWRWTTDPVGLLEAGAATGPVFGLRLWRPVVAGYLPDWNRAVLGDLDTFRSHGSLSGLTPYLDGGVVHADVPVHRPRRRALNPHFGSRALDRTRLVERMRSVARQHRPVGTFDALVWSGRVVRSMLNTALFAGLVPDPLLASFLAPLHRRVPAPLLPRPVLFRRLDAAIARIVAAPPPGTLAEHLAGMPYGAEELRVALAAGYDTTAHTLAWAVWQLADAAPGLRCAEALPDLIDEVLRLYPAGWLGSRICVRDSTVAGVDLPAGTMVLYSPYLTHRDPDLWPEPTRFRPERFRDGRPAWGFLPFGAGPRTCLGAHLARQMLACALESVLTGRLSRVRGDPRVRTSLTLRPRGPLVLRHEVRAGRPGGRGDR